jgi:hypothetical protein
MRTSRSGSWTAAITPDAHSPAFGFRACCPDDAQGRACRLIHELAVSAEVYRVVFPSIGTFEDEMGHPKAVVPIVNPVAVLFAENTRDGGTARFVRATTLKGIKLNEFRSAHSK